jgi:hypothetical protein
MADRDLDERAHQYWRSLAAQTQRQSAEALGMRTNQRQRIDEDEPETLRQRQRFTPCSRLGLQQVRKPQPLWESTSASTT